MTRLTVNVIPAVTVTDKSGELTLSDGVYTAESKAGEGNQITIAANPSAGCTVETSLSSAEIQQLLQNKKITVLGNVITVANDAPGRYGGNPLPDERHFRPQHHAWLRLHRPGAGRRGGHHRFGLLSADGRARRGDGKQGRAHPRLRRG